MVAPNNAQLKTKYPGYQNLKKKIKEERKMRPHAPFFFYLIVFEALVPRVKTKQNRKQDNKTRHRDQNKVNK